MEHRISLLVCRSALAICLSCGLAGIAMAQTSEGFPILWQGTTFANDLGNVDPNGVAQNDGVINILGDDSINTLTITAIEAGTPNGPDAAIAQSSQDGLISQNPGGLDPWWRTGNYMDLQFSLSGGATQLFFGGGVFTWFNTEGNGSGQPDPNGTGESLIVKNMSQGGTVLATLDHTSITSALGLDGVLIDGLGLEIPLGDTIRFEAMNTIVTGTWPENSWLIRLTNFSSLTPPVLTADFDMDNDVDGDDFLIWQRDLGDAANLANWESEYGMTIPLVASVAAVPEPATFGLLVGGCLLIGGIRCRRNFGVAS